MQLAHVYLNFPGTTEEALRYYEKVFGTKITMMQTYGDTPFVKNAPESSKKKIMHAALPITEHVHLMASDSTEGMGPALKVGNNVRVCIVAKDKAEADHAFALLSEGGSVQMQIANAPWGPYFGMCTDKFGIGWMVTLPTPA